MWDWPVSNASRIQFVTHLHNYCFRLLCSNHTLSTPGLLLCLGNINDQLKIYQLPCCASLVIYSTENQDFRMIKELNKEEKKLKLKISHSYSRKDFTKGNFGAAQFFRKQSQWKNISVLDCAYQFSLSIQSHYVRLYLI